MDDGESESGRFPHMEIGKERRTVKVEPIENPVPQRVPKRQPRRRVTPKRAPVKQPEREKVK